MGAIIWHKIYRIVAFELNEFYLKNKEASGEKLFRLLSDHVDEFPWIKDFGHQPKNKSVDPIHVFSSFSGFGLSNENRLKRIQLVLGVLNKKFRSNLYVQVMDVTGCPSPIALLLYRPRVLKYQNEIWETFGDVYKNGKEGLPENVFKMVAGWPGVSVGLFTIFLFWIKPKTFLPMDSNTVRLLKSEGKLPRTPKTRDEYLSVLGSEDKDLYINLAAIAYKTDSYSELPVSQKNSIDKYFGRAPSIIGTQGESVSRGEFRLLAIKPLEGCDDKYRKTLKEEQLYTFYDGYKILGNSITVDRERVFNPYTSPDEKLQINIHAVVGKNGTGKSSLVELLYAAVNNIAYKKFKSIDKSYNELHYAQGVNVEFYYLSNKIYKIRLYNNKITINIYKPVENGNYIRERAVKFSDFDLESFFYTIGVNYSLHSLNRRNFDNWLDEVFHKNDAYQSPIVLEPYRREGNIDVNRLNELVKSRLLANLLEPEDEKYSYRQITDNLKAEYIKYELDIEKVRYVLIADGSPKTFEDVFDDPKGILDELFKAYEINNISSKVNLDINKNSSLENISKLYLLKKLFNISMIYSHYNKYIDRNNFKLKENVVDEFIEELRRDNGHITYKIKQVLNYLSKDIYPRKKSGKLAINVINASLAMERSSSSRFKTMDFLLPSFFKVNIFLSDNILFDSLSSGEKQNVYTIHSILYHIKNIESVAEGSSSLVVFNQLNIVLDEIELYFHPEMQRLFLNKLLMAIKRMPLNSISSLNITFVTHSPFVLSDIPKSNILFLDENERSTLQSEDFQTFGGNVIDLLSNSFFLKKGYIGEFAKNKIQEVINILQDDYKDKSVVDRESLLTTINLIGEPFLKDKLIEMYYDNYDKEKRIKILEDKLDELKK